MLPRGEVGEGCVAQVLGEVTFQLFVRAGGGLRLPRAEQFGKEQCQQRRDRAAAQRVLRVLFPQQLREKERRAVAPRRKDGDAVRLERADLRKQRRRDDQLDDHVPRACARQLMGDPRRQQGGLPLRQ